jgi:hypothetical protein
MPRRQAQRRPLIVVATPRRSKQVHCLSSEGVANTIEDSG